MILGVVGLAACGGGGSGERSAERSPTTVEPTTTTVAEHRIDVYQPIPGGSLHGTPRPPLENTGDDYVAITESLIANFRWLTENPDLAVLDEIYASGTPTGTFQSEVFGRLRADRWRAADDGYVVRELTLSSVAGDTVILRLVDQVEFESIVDASGNRVGDGVARGVPQVWTATLARDDGGRWRFADLLLNSDQVVEF